MNLTFQTKYLSIDEFKPVELSDFTILTGVNGSGKTHLLRSLKEGKCKIDSINTKNIIFFNLEEFKAEQEKEYTQDQVILQRQVAWDFLSQTNKIKEPLTRIKLKYFNDEDAKKIQEIAQNKKKSIFSLNDNDLENEADLKNKMRSYKDEIHDYFSDDTYVNNQTVQGIYTVTKKHSSFIDDVSQSEFLASFVPVMLKKNFLPSQLGRIFLDYRMKEFEEYHRNLESPSTVDHANLKDEAKRKCRNMYGGSEPWTIVNDFLNAYNGFRYNITKPDEFEFDSYFNMKKTAFTPELHDKQSNLSIKYEDLSSGEKILFALALCMLKGKYDNIFPQLLMLDEIDATLHPSMIENMLSVIKEILLPKQVKVILATHSPTTVALSPENAIFLVNSSGPNRITKSNKKDALEILTEGYMTLEEGIKIFDQISKKEISIISEGNNTKYIKKALEILAVDNKERIEVIEGLESISGKDQLKTLYDVFSAIDHNSKIFFVWDCDFKKKLTAKNNTFPYIFEKNSSNDIASNGIENMFDEQHFAELVNTTKKSSGEIHESFDTERKKDFMNKMMGKASLETFARFKPLFEYIDNKIESNNAV